MAFTNYTLSGLLGLNVQGDLAGFTMYTGARRQLVVFAKSPPLEPASPLQKFYRDRLRTSAQAWQQLTPTARKNWELMAKRSHVKMTGYNLFSWWQWYGDDEPIHTLERQSGITVL